MIMFIPIGLMVFFYSCMCIQDYQIKRKGKKEKEHKRGLKEHKALNELTW